MNKKQESDYEIIFLNRSMDIQISKNVDRELKIIIGYLASIATVILSFISLIIKR